MGSFLDRVNERGILCEGNDQSDSHSYLTTLFEIDCSLGSNPYGVPDNILGLDLNTHVKLLSTYFDFSNTVELTLMLQGYLETTGVGAEQLFLAHGSFDGISHLFHTFFSGRRMLGIGPQFAEVVGEWKFSHRDYSAVPLRLDSDKPFPLEGLLAEMANPDNNVALIYIDNPNNPTGSVVDLATLKTLAAAAREAGVFVLVDEAYGDYFPIENSAFNLLSEFENVICSRSFSKGWGLAAIRVGYLGVHPSMCHRFRRIAKPFSPSLFSSKIASHALKDPEFVVRNRALVSRDKAHLIAAFRDAGFEVLPTHPTVPIFTIRWKGLDVERALKALGICVSSGKHFQSTCKDIDESYARVRIPGNPVDIAHITYRLQTTWSYEH